MSSGRLIINERKKHHPVHCGNSIYLVVIRNSHSTHLAINGVTAQLDNSGINETAIDISIGLAPIEVNIADKEALKNILEENQ